MPLAQEFTKTDAGAGIIVLSRDAAFSEIQRRAGYDADLIAEYFGDMVEEA